MEKVNEGWIEVMTTNENGSTKLNLKEKFLKVQLNEIMIVMHMH
jgi:hypothetical protein